MGTAGIRDLITMIAPTWLRSGVVPNSPGNGFRYLYTSGAGVDLAIEKMDEAMLARMPTRGTVTALPYLGRDRVIVRGFQETDATYAERLRRAFDSWARAGSDRGLLSNLLAYVSPATPMGRAVTSDEPSSDFAVWRTYVPGASGQNLNGPPSTLTIGPSNWNWDSAGGPNVRGWWRTWPIIFAVAPDDWCHPGPKWGAGLGWKWGDHSRAWGFDRPYGVYQTMRTILAQWKRAGSIVPWLIVSFDATMFDPSKPADNVKNPDGTWGYWHKNIVDPVTGITTAVAARNASARYIDGAMT
jgi:hypothetical protein